MKKKLLLLCTVFCVLFSLFVFPAASEQIKAPKVHFDEPVYNFKPVFEGKVIIHDYIVKNLGDSPLLIEQIQAG
ncbi:MAG: hypothetical protein ABIJ31_12420 [Pseudomonadota bacterium]